MNHPRVCFRRQRTGHGGAVDASRQVASWRDREVEPPRAMAQPHRASFELTHPVSRWQDPNLDPGSACCRAAQGGGAECWGVPRTLARCRTTSAGKHDSWYTPLDTPGSGTVLSRIPSADATTTSASDAERSACPVV